MGEKGKKSKTMSISQSAAKEHKEQLERLQKKVSSFVLCFLCFGFLDFCLKFFFFLSFFGSLRKILSFLLLVLQDPEFYQYLQQHGKDLLTFDDEDIDVSYENYVQGFCLFQMAA